MDAEEPPDEEIARVRSGRVPSTGTSVLEELGCVQPPSTGMRSQPGTFQTPHRRDFEGCFITQAGRTVSWEEGRWGCCAGATQRHLTGTKGIPITQERSHQGVCVGTGVKDQLSH